MVGRRMSPRDMRPMGPPRDGHHMGPPRGPPPSDRDIYPPVYQTPSSRPKREYRKTSPDMRRPRSRSMSPPPKKRHPPPPPPPRDDGYRGRGSPPPMRRRRSFTPPPAAQMRRERSPPPPSAQMRRERSRSPAPPPPPPPPQRKQRAASPAPAPRGSQGSSVPRSSHGGSHGHRGSGGGSGGGGGSSGGGGGGESREQPARSQRAAEPATDGQPAEFYGPWGTRITRSDLKKITVDIKRTVPKNKRSSSPIIRRIINADDINLHRRTGEGSRPMLERPELQSAVNRRFDDAPPAPPEPRVVAIIREPSHVTGERREGSPYEHRSRSGERGFAQQSTGHAPVPVGERIDRERSERTQRQVAKLEQMEVAIDRKLDQIQRYERKYEESLRDEKYGDAKDDRKLVDRSVRDRLGPRRDRPRSMSPKRGDRDRGYDGPEPRDPLPDFSQRPDKPPIWGADEAHMRTSYYHEGRDNGFRGGGGRGRGGFRARGRGAPRGRGGRFSPPSWQHDRYEAY